MAQQPITTRIMTNFEYAARNATSESARRYYAHLAGNDAIAKSDPAVRSARRTQERAKTSR